MGDTPQLSLRSLEASYGISRIWGPVAHSSSPPRTSWPPSIWPTARPSTPRSRRAASRSPPGRRPRGRSLIDPYGIGLMTGSILTEVDVVARFPTKDHFAS